MKKFNLNAMANIDMLKITSLVIAIILFVIVNQIGNPIWTNLFTVKEYVVGVKVSTLYDESQYVVSGVPSVIDVSITGSENNVKSVLKSVESLEGSLDLTSYKPGKYTINPSQIEFSTASQVSISPSLTDLEVNIEQKVSSAYTINTTYINASEQASGVLLDQPSMSKSEVLVTGSSSRVDSVSAVMGLIDLSKINAVEGKNSQEIVVPLVAYDQSGNVVEDIVIEPSEIIVTQSYDITSISLPVTYEFLNNDTSMYVSRICPIDKADCDETYSDVVQVYGDAEKISELDSITYQIDLNNLSKSGGEAFGRPVLTSNVYVLGEETRTYNIEFEKGITKEFTNVSVVPSGLDPTLTAIATSQEDSTVDLKVTGAASVVEKLTNEQITILIDLSNITSPGTYDIPVVARNNQNVSYELSKSTIKVEIKEK